MTLADISIKNPVFAWMLMAALMIFGLLSYTRMGVSELPDVDFPVASVNLSWQGAAPEVMETDIVDPIEDAVMSVQGVKNVTSSILMGSATISVEFELGKNIDVAVNEIQTRIAQVQRLLPPEMDPPTVTKVNPEDQPIIWLSVTGLKTLPELMGYVNDELKDKFSTIDGVGQIVLGGYVDRNLRIWVNADKLRQYQLTADDVVNAVQAQHQEVPAGSLDTLRKSLNVRIMGEALSPEEFGNIIIEKRAGVPILDKTIRLKDIARIENGLNDVQRISRTSGKLAVGLGIRKQRGANEVATAMGVLKRLQEVRPLLPKGIDVNVVMNRSKFVTDSIRELMFTLILSAIVTSLVCWLFLGAWTATLNILLAIPTSILGTFFVIYFFKFTLNTFTVLGLSLAVGIVVDDAIMVLENIVRYQEHGVERVEAARTGARQITFAALAASLALIAIFLPVAFMKGIIGKFFFQYGVTISVAVALSLLEALTLTPMRSSQFLHIGTRTTWLGKGVESTFKSLAAFYEKTLRWVLEHKLRIIGAATVFFLVSFVFLALLRKEFVPSQDQSLLLCRVQTPPDSSIDYTSDRFHHIEQFVLNRPEVDHYFAAIGGFQGGQNNQGFMFLTLKDPAKRPIAPPFKHRPSQLELMGLFRRELNKITNTRVILQDLSASSFAATRGFPIEFSLQGQDWETLIKLSEKMKQKMISNPLFTDVDTDYLPRVNEIHILPDRFKAASRGVDVGVIGREINNLIGGMAIGKYTENGRRYDVRIRLEPDERTKTTDISKLQVWNNHGELVNLNEVVDLTNELTSQTITRRNRERAITFFANVAQGKSQTKALAEVRVIAAEFLPEYYHVVFTGTAQTFTESFASLFVVLLLGILVSYMVLASQFNSYIHPVTVLIALPFSISGALITLWITGQTLNVYSFIGIILLMGIVKKNSILLVDFTNQYRAQNMPVKEALIKACPIRLRPILMTSLATIAAAIPPALALGPGGETRRPMALAVIGGVIFSTLLTLLVVPCVYSLFSRLERKTYSQEAIKPALTPLKKKRIKLVRA